MDRAWRRRRQHWLVAGRALQAAQMMIVLCKDILMDILPLDAGPTVRVAIVGTGGTEGPLPGGPSGGLRAGASLGG